MHVLTGPLPEPTPQPGSPAHDAVAVSLEAAACCLQVLSSPGLPTTLYREELVTGLVTLIKFHLQYNLLVMHDVKYRRLYRPSSLVADGEGEGEGEAKGKGKKKPKAAAAAAAAPK